jgi:putative spermidine/putrescine transport system substrate-binding protein
MLAVIRPFQEQTGGWVNVEDYNGGLNQIRAQVDSLNVKWDVVDLHMEDVLRGCKEGLLEKIDHGILELAPDGSEAQRDFLPDMLPECGVGTMVFSTVFAYDGERMKRRLPSRISDFFNLAKFPGNRGLRLSPKGALEWALLADGVPQDRIYTTLSREEGLRRAFAKLDTIKKHIIWWRTGAEPAQLLAEGAVVMTSAWNGRIHEANQRKRGNFVIVWDSQLWEYDLWAIPKGSENRSKALDFIAFATTTDRLAEQTNHIPYGPARRSSMSLISGEVRPKLPNALQNTENFLRIDNAWWAENQRRIDREFSDWLRRESLFIEHWGTPDFPGSSLPR